MKWIDTQELVSMLKRFPDEQLEASACPVLQSAANYLWKYSTAKKRFLLSAGANLKSYAEAELLRRYGGLHWKPNPSLFLKGYQERQIAIRLVEELGMLGLLEDIIVECELENVRVCEHCHHLMDEGWLVDDAQAFCSDECLKKAYPSIDISNLRSHAVDEDCQAYWTKWEG